MVCGLCNQEIVGRVHTVGSPMDPVFSCAPCLEVCAQFGAFVLDCELPR